MGYCDQFVSLCNAWRELAEILSSTEVDEVLEHTAPRIQAYREALQPLDYGAFKSHYLHQIDKHALRMQKKLSEFGLTLAHLSQEGFEGGNKDDRAAFHASTAHGGGRKRPGDPDTRSAKVFLCWFHSLTIN